MTILEQIIAFKKQEVAGIRQKYPTNRLEKSKYFNRIPLKMTDFVTDPSKTGIIAEFKRKSPSKGIINAQSGIEEVTTGYFRCGAAGLSILTDHEFFGGEANDLKRARELNPIPILRKDFIIDEYQITEAKSIGADMILLIAAALETTMTKMLAAHAHSLGLQVLLEIHDAGELSHLNAHIDIIGVNNRDLKTFVVDIEKSVELSAVLPPELVKISESGITSPIAFKKLKGCGYQGFLIGESFMHTDDPARAFAGFVESIL